MGWRVTWNITCDECGANGPQRSEGRTPGGDALRAAIKRGWLEARCPYGIYLHLCAACAAKRRPDWWPEDADEDAT